MAKKTWSHRHILGREPPARGWKKTPKQSVAKWNDLFHSPLSMCNPIPHTCKRTLCLSVLVHHCFIKGLQKVRQKCVKTLQNSPKTGQKGQNIPLFMIKSTLAWKRYTTADCDGCDYGLCLQCQKGRADWTQIVLTRSIWAIACSNQFICLKWWVQKREREWKDGWALNQFSRNWTEIIRFIFW